MTAQIRSKALLFAALLGAATLAACGGDSSSSDASKDDPAASHAAADKIIAQAIAANPKASAGRIDGTIDLKIKGIPRFKGTTELTAGGVYNLPDGADVPDFNIDVGLSLNEHAIGGGIVLAGGKGFVTLGSTGYPLPGAIAQKLAEPAPAAKNGLTKTAAIFFINPQNWQENAQLVGDATIAGESTQQLKADIDPKRVFEDLARLTRLLTRLHVTQAVGLPTALGPQVRAALVRSVKLAQGEVWIGKDDHVLRKAHLEGKIVVAERDRKLLEGMTSATLDAVVTVSDVGQPQTVDVPDRLGSYSALQLALDALGESVRNQTG